MANLKWRGEGYGLDYYPKTKQTKSCGYDLQDPKHDNCEKISETSSIFKKLDSINKYKTIITDSLTTAHASIALRKECVLISDDLPYKIEFFGKGTIKSKKDD